MIKTILIPLDGSTLGEVALPLAVHLARAPGTRLLLVHATGDLALLTRLEAELGIAVRLEPHLDALRRSDVPTTPGTVGRLSSSAILRVVREDDVDLVVMSMQGEVADDLLRRVEVPVLLVPPNCDRRWEGDRPLRLMVPLNGSPHDEAAVAPARALARIVRVELLLVRAVWDPAVDPCRLTPKGQIGTTLVGKEPANEARRNLKAVARNQGTAFASIDILVSPGEPDRVIADAAHNKDVDVVVIADRGANHSERHALGSIATTMLQRTPLPVLLAPLTSQPPSPAERLATAVLG